VIHRLTFLIPYQLSGLFWNEKTFVCYRKSPGILCFVDRASLYNLVNKSNYVHNSVNTFISLLYMFRASMCPSSQENFCISATLVFVTLYGWRLVCWLDRIQPADLSSHIQSDKYQWRIDTEIFSWWWTNGCPKHVEKRNK